MVSFLKLLCDVLIFGSICAISNNCIDGSICACSSVGGEYFHGNLPIVSQVMKLVFLVHARWVAWSTEHHINHYAFTANSSEEEEMEEESRKNMPLFLLKHYAWSDLTAMVFGIKDDANQKKSPSFLVRRGSQTHSEEDKLPIQRKEVKLQISQDIVYDRESAKQMLARSDSQTPEDAKVVLARSYTLRNMEANRKGSAYGFATEAARQRQMTRRDSPLPKKVGTRSTAKGPEADGSKTEKRQA
jgi:hypothetical protein